MSATVQSEHRLLPDGCAVARECGRMGPVNIGERVQIDGRDGIFVVLRVDTDRGAADLLLMSGVRRIESNIPLGTIHVLRDQGRLPEAEPA